MQSNPNATHATGPRTPEGKSRSARNAIKYGLYAAHDFVPLGAEPIYKYTRSTLLEEMAPATPDERDLAERVINATWRVQLCQWADRAPSGPESPAPESIERARVRALSAMLRNMDKLHRMQEERLAALDPQPATSKTIQ
jgi:hypothetical protein